MRGLLSRQALSTLVFGLVALGVLLITPRRLIGDGGEYFSMARTLYAGGDPGVPRHFWGYPLMAVPLLRTLVPLKVDQLWSFALLNLMLFTIAWWHASARWPFGVRLALFGGPVIWWVDKAHTEVLTFSALVVAWATWRGAPWWALGFCGLATMQNPPLGAALVGFAALSAWANPPWLRDGRWWAGALAGFAIAGTHAAYYLATAGRLTMLGDTVESGIHWAAWWAVLFEPNVGLAAHAPALVALGLLSAAVTLVRSAARRDALLDLGWSMALGVVFLLAFTHVGNINHGGTPGVSRYALWMIALLAPWLVAGWAAGWRWRRVMATLAVLSAAWSLWAFWPARPESHLRPTRLAEWLWTAHPTWMDPPPEVFADRLGGTEDPQLPIATRRCEKVLFIGRGDGKAESPWPSACPPAEIPEACRPAGALCYGNLTAAGYVFRALNWPPRGYHFARGATWSAASLAVALEHLGPRSWGAVRPVRDGDGDRWLRASAGLARADQFNAASGCLLALQQVGAQARVSMRLPSRGTATVIDATAGRIVRSVRVDAPPGERIDIDVSGPADALLLIVDYTARHP